MKEYLELRVREEFAGLLFGEREGRKLGGEVYPPSIRLVRLSTSDPRLAEVERLDHQCKATHDTFFFAGWRFIRTYTKKEIDNAQLFHIWPTAFFEPSGEECGTEYDYNTTCPLCGAGRIQASDLVLDLRRVPRSKDIASTIGYELVVSERLATLLREWGTSGYSLSPVHHRAYFANEPFDYRRFESGRKLIEMAEKAGILYCDTYRFCRWLSRPEHAALVQAAEQESAGINGQRAARRVWQPPVYYQLHITSRPLRIHPVTRWGDRPFERGSESRYRCPRGHTLGWSILSELHVQADDYDGSDIVRTAEVAANNRSPLLVISPRLFRLLRQHHIRGFDYEVAHVH